MRTIGFALCAAALLAGGSARAQATPARDRAVVRTSDDTDFDRVNPGIGFGWFGFSDVPVGGATDAVSAPVLGVRWWMGAPLGPFRAWGLDLGLGLNRTSTSQTGVSDVTRTAFVIHAGLPLAVTATQHLAIELVPEMNLGFASGKSSAVGAPDNADLGGSRFDLGGRAAAEVFFGFMGLPQLSLEGSVGLFLSRAHRSVQPSGGSETSSTTWTFGTTVHNQPWDIFRSSVAARYYF